MYNKVILIGRLADDAEPNTTKEGKKGFVFHLAIGIDDTSLQDVDFHMVQGVGSPSKELLKGALVVVEGELVNDFHTNADSSIGYTKIIKAKDITLLNSK